MLKSKLSERVSILINSSVESMTSSLNFEDNLEVLEAALKICKRRNAVTMTAMLERKLKKISKSPNQPNH